MLNLLTKMVSEDTFSKMIMGCLGALLGLLLSIWMDIGGLIVLSLLLILIDCYTAKRLAKRVMKKYGKDRASAKFSSIKFAKVMKNLAISSTALLATWLIYVLVLVPLHKEWIPLHIYTCGAIIIWQVLSMLENESSCNGSKWAILLQKVLVDKTQRHLDIDLSSVIKHFD